MKPKKFLVFDAGPIISLTMNGLLPILEKLKKEFDGEFVITPDVKKEVVDRPLKIKKYALEGVKVSHLIEKGVLVLSSKFVSDSVLNREAKKILKSVNSAFRDEKTGDKIGLIHEGEASLLAFANLCKCNNVIVIDERTTRMLTEAPEKLEHLMEKKLHTDIDADIDKLKELERFKFIRSAELLYVAYKKNLFELKKNKVLLDALLYGVKFNGAAISSREIEKIKKLV
ncbi:hypothetical protein CMI37_35255 [Candidatus Pacearchaeota archaeon]|nr:hypothetical protein [Candidatus Pacearchaeota archaeon]|tara:strand:- start:1885 stop:2568 length:684 start_codon:yes stop_codon:yes gene_type:complete